MVTLYSETLKLAFPLIFLHFFKSLKHVKTYSEFMALQKQAVSWIWPMGYSLLTLQDDFSNQDVSKKSWLTLDNLGIIPLSY